MKRKSAVIAVAAVVAGILAACGHDHSSEMPPPPPPPTSTAINVTTSELLANYAMQPAETGSPVAVNNGMFTLTDTSETTTPLSINSN